MNATKFLVLIALLASLIQVEAEPIHVYFSPRGGCTEAVVSELSKARSNILVQAYSFTSKPIAEALVAARKRGVQVFVILDSSQETEKYSSATFLSHSKVQTFIDSAHQIAHNKIMILDGQKVITGSFNFTKAAEDSNAENLLVIVDPQLAARYTANWNAHAKHSHRYKGPVAPKTEPHHHLLWGLGKLKPKF